MSVAYDLDLDRDLAPSRQPVAPRHPGRALALVPPIVSPAPLRAPGRSRTAQPPLAVLRPLDDPAPLRLTRRGAAVLAAVVGALGVTLAVFGAVSAHASGDTPTQAGPAVVTVRAGDTLWSIASAAAPGLDPRTEIATIDSLNALHGESLVPGQRVRVR